MILEESYPIIQLVNIDLQKETTAIVIHRVTFSVMWGFQLCLLSALGSDKPTGALPVVPGLIAAGSCQMSNRASYRAGIQESGLQWWNWCVSGNSGCHAARTYCYASIETP
jgi:hypothetical protein